MDGAKDGAEEVVSRLGTPSERRRKRQESVTACAIPSDSRFDGIRHAAP